MVLRRKEGRKVLARGPCFELYEVEEKGFLENLALNCMKKEAVFSRGPCFKLHGKRRSFSR